MDIDLRTAKRIDTMKVGTRVKVLTRTYDTSPWEVKHGVILGFEPFKTLPTIVVAVAQLGYSEAKIDFLYYNSESKNVELVVALDDDVAALDKADFLNKVAAEIAKKEQEIKVLQDRANYFEEKFACYWTQPEAEPEEQVIATCDMSRTQGEG